MRSGTEIAGHILAIPDKNDPNELLVLEIVYDIPRSAREYYTPNVTDSLEILLNEEVIRIKAYDRIITIPFHTHKSLERPSRGDVKSLNELYEWSKNHPNLPFYFPNFGIIVVGNPEVEIIFDDKGNFRELKILHL